MLPHDAVSGVGRAGVLLSQRTAAGGGGAAVRHVHSCQETLAHRPENQTR